MEQWPMLHQACRRSVTSTTKNTMARCKSMSTEPTIDAKMRRRPTYGIPVLILLSHSSSPADTHLTYIHQLLPRPNTHLTHLTGVRTALWQSWAHRIAIMWKQPGRYIRTHSQKHARWYTWNGRLEERERRLEKQYFRSLVDNGLDYWELGPKYLAWPRKKGKDVPKEGLVTEIMALGYGEFKSDESTDVLLHHLNRAQRGLMMYSKYSIEELAKMVHDRGGEVSVNSTRSGKASMIEWLEKADDEQKFEKFMELSPELREMVYKEVFADLPPVLMAPIAHPITMTSQLVRHETLPLFRAESLVAWDVWNSGTSRFRWPAGPGFDDTMLRSLVRVVVPWTNQIRAELTVELSYDRRARVLNVSKVWSLPGSRFARASQDARDAFVEALRVFHEHEWKGETQSTMSSVNFAGQLWTFGS